MKHSKIRRLPRTKCLLNADYVNLVVNKDTFHLCNNVKQISCRKNSKLSGPTPPPLQKPTILSLSNYNAIQHIRINYIQSVASATRFFKRTNQNLQSRSAFSCWNACGYSLYATQLRALYMGVKLTKCDLQKFMSFQCLFHNDWIY